MSGGTLVTLVSAAHFAGVAYCLHGPAAAPGPRWCRFEFLLVTTGLAGALAAGYWAAAEFCAATLVLLSGD